MSSEQAYRPDIDGLRAVAVLIIMCFHVGFEPFSGGFVSLDIFFVVSGFLITGIILNQVDMEKERLSGYSKYYYSTYTRYYHHEAEKE